VSLPVALLLGLLSTADRPLTAGMARARLVRSPTTRGELSDASVLALLEQDTQVMLAGLGVEAALSSRHKSAESLAAKAARKGIAPHQVLDRLALRVRVDDEADCYRVFDALLARHRPVTGSIDDYIAQPKANGYQSLHAAVLTPLGIAEFQVRTHEMHHHAEHGAAAHAHYKAATA
jgi:GTP pyrophosphokinase